MKVLIALLPMVAFVLANPTHKGTYQYVPAVVAQPPSYTYSVPPPAPAPVVGHKAYVGPAPVVPPAPAPVVPAPVPVQHTYIQESRPTGQKSGYVALAPPPAPVHVDIPAPAPVQYTYTQEVRPVGQKSGYVSPAPAPAPVPAPVQYTYTPEVRPVGQKSGYVASASPVQYTFQAPAPAPVPKPVTSWGYSYTTASLQAPKKNYHYQPAVVSKPASYSYSTAYTHPVKPVYGYTYSAPQQYAPSPAAFGYSFATAHGVNTYVAKPSQTGYSFSPVPSPVAYYYKAPTYQYYEAPKPVVPTTYGVKSISAPVVAPAPAPVAVVEEVKSVPGPAVNYGTTTQYHAQDEIGQYSYGYLTADGQAKAETKSADGTVTGRYSYFDPTGKRVEVAYIADGAGFRAVGNNFPQAPELPEALKKAYADHAAAKAAVAYKKLVDDIDDHHDDVFDDVDDHHDDGKYYKVDDDDDGKYNADVHDDDDDDHDDGSYRAEHHDDGGYYDDGKYRDEDDGLFDDADDDDHKIVVAAPAPAITYAVQPVTYVGAPVPVALHTVQQVAQVPVAQKSGYTYTGQF